MSPRDVDMETLIEFDSNYTENQTLHLMRLWSQYIRVHLTQQEMFLANWGLIAEHLDISDLQASQILERSFYETVKSTREQVAYINGIIKANGKF